MSASSQSGFENRIMFSFLSPSSVFRELFASPPKSVGVKVREVTPAGGKVPKIVFEFSNLPEGESDRRKKLLNSIDKVEEQVLQQLEILKNTASAKEADRANRGSLLLLATYSSHTFMHFLFLFSSFFYAFRTIPVPSIVVNSPGLQNKLWMRSLVQRVMDEYSQDVRWLNCKQKGFLGDQPVVGCFFSFIGFHCSLSAEAMGLSSHGNPYL
ncbi:hypothetical protein ACSQ67_022841 [Phaseolus vulgaris]